MLKLSLWYLLAASARKDIKRPLIFFKRPLIFFSFATFCQLVLALSFCYLFIYVTMFWCFRSFESLCWPHHSELHHSNRHSRCSRYTPASRGHKSLWHKESCPSRHTQLWTNQSKAMGKWCHCVVTSVSVSETSKTAVCIHSHGFPLICRGM